uniref:Uncharacterized protein n=1 Tax=Opuntia streptacantha TaxID=393608 RepID=A0A7C9AXJ2_OPUST
MLKLKTKIRKFQEFALLNLQQRICLSTSSDAEFVDLEKRMSVIVAQTAAEEQECEREQNLHNQLHQELDDSKRRKELIEGIMKDIEDLQDLTRQTSELEEKCASFSEELQRRCICPSCHVDNSNSLAELLQQMEQQ